MAATAVSPYGTRELFNTTVAMLIRAELIPAGIPMAITCFAAGLQPFKYWIWQDLDGLFFVN